MVRKVTWSQVLAWRLGRQFIEPPGTASVVEVARRLAGVQAQVASAAELAIAVRQSTPTAGAVPKALWEDAALVKTWAMRGTLHLLPADEAGAYLALCATVRNWEKASWRRVYKTSPAELETMAAAAAAALAGGGALTREQLGAEILERTGSVHLAEFLSSGWGSILKPLAWWGVLCFGPSEGNRVTFCAPAERIPGWSGVPPVEEAARTVIRAYLGAHGPATPADLDAWIMRGALPKKMLRGWFAAMADELVEVEVDGTPASILKEHADELVETEPVDGVRMLGGFDQYVLGAGTKAVYLIPAERRSEVSRAAGWISAVVLRGGRVVGVWDPKEGAAAPTLWEKVPGKPLAAEQARLAALLG